MIHWTWLVSAFWCGMFLDSMIFEYSVWRPAKRLIDECIEIIARLKGVE